VRRRADVFCDVSGRAQDTADSSSHDPSIDGGADAWTTRDDAGACGEESAGIMIDVFTLPNAKLLLMTVCGRRSISE
jgi:hypothetical protein